jgi:hypothetical protein
VESVCRGLSDRDVAKGVKGHGRPLYADPRSAGGANEPGTERSAMQGRMSGAFSLCLLSLCANKEKVRRRRGRNL